MIIKNKQYEKVKNEKIWSKLGTRSSNLAPVNLSKNKRNWLLIDTETIGDITKGEKAYPYDISFLMVRLKKILHQVCYINSDIFDEKYLMENAFYKNKIPFYNLALKNDKRYIKKHDKDILLELNNFIKKNNITYFVAFNVKFDYNSINNLYEITGYKENYFKKLYVVDVWKIATDIVAMFPELYECFMLFCYNNNYITESGLNVRTNAECFNRFVNNDTTFIECHTGLEDTLCEVNILLKMLWYYEKHTGKDYYYKLDTIFNGHKKIFNGGIFNTSHIPYILEKHNLTK